METEIAIAAITLVGAMVQTVAGFGFSLLVVPTLVIFMEPAQAVPISAVLSFMNALRVSHSVREHAPWRLVFLLLAGSVIGLPLGVYVLLYTSAEVLRVLVGVTAATMAGAIWFGLRWKHSDVAAGLTGFVSGILTTSTAINGPPIVLYLQASGLPPTVFRAALSNLFVLNGVFALTGFVWAGVLGVAELRQIAIGIPFLLGGYWLGQKLLGRLDPERFQKFVLMLLAVAGAATATVALLRLL
ncbi:MAG: sulfite exporter TauE/SafE family protein [Deltaproteobacteria bacterium]